MITDLIQSVYWRKHY